MNLRTRQGLAAFAVAAPLLLVGLIAHFGIAVVGGLWAAIIGAALVAYGLVRA